MQSHSVKTWFPLVVMLYLVVFILSTLSRKENNEIRMDTDLALKRLYVMLCRLTWKSWWWNLSIFGHDHLKTKHKPIRLCLTLRSMLRTIRHYSVQLCRILQVTREKGNSHGSPTFSVDYLKILSI